MMLSAGIAWGIYSLRGRGVADPNGATAGNFLRAAIVGAAERSAAGATATRWIGHLYAVLFGAVASGLGYALCHAALRGLAATRTAALQLSAPVLAALAGLLFLRKPITLLLMLTSVAILGGIAMVVFDRRPV